ncbi:MAG: PEGA domain-containing protein [Methanobacteriota archaeon]
MKLIVLDERISPLTLQGVAIGPHSILIKKDSYSEYSRDVHIVPDQASGLSVTLTGIVTVAPTSVPTQPPAPMPTKSPLSPWAAVCGLALAGLGYAVRK